MGIAAEAADLKIEVTRVERVTQGRRGLRRSRPGVAGELVGFPARLSRALGRYSDRRAIKSVRGFKAG